MTMVWEKQKSGEWVGVENKPEGIASIIRHGIERRWRVDVRTAGNKSGWAILGSIPAAKLYAERFIDKHTW